MTQGARICPHCKRRVDERRSKGLAYCLSCGQPLAGFQRTSGPPSHLTPPASSYGAGPASNYGVPPSHYGATSSSYGAAPPSSPYGVAPPSFPTYPAHNLPVRSGGGSTGLVLGLVFGGMAVFILSVVAFFLVRSSAPAPTPTPVATSTVAVESTAAAAIDSTAPTATAHHVKPTSTVVPFPLSRAVEQMDQAVIAAEKICPRASGPFGTTVVDVTFENDGRVGTSSRPPFGGTPTGACVTAQFLEIHVGAFQGSARTFSKVVTIQSPSAAPTSTSPATSATTHAARLDAGR